MSAPPEGDPPVKQRTGERLELDLVVVARALWLVTAAGLALAFVLARLAGHAGVDAVAQEIPNAALRALAALFLPRRKSRALAVTLVVVSAGDALVTLSHGHVPWADLATLAVGARAIQVAFAWHRREDTELRPGNIVGVALVAGLLSVAAAAAAEMALAGVVAPSLVDAAAAVSFMAVATVGCLGLLPFTGHRPFAVVHEPEPPAISTSSWGEAPAQTKTSPSLLGALVVTLVIAVGVLVLSHPWSSRPAARRAAPVAAPVAAAARVHAAPVEPVRGLSMHFPPCYTGAAGERYAYRDEGKELVAARITDVPFAVRASARCVSPPTAAGSPAVPGERLGMVRP